MSAFLEPSVMGGGAHLPQATKLERGEFGEVGRLGETAGQFFGVMLGGLARHLETVLQPVLELTQGLEDRTRPEEAARRMDKSQQSKGRGGKGGA